MIKHTFHGSGGVSYCKRCDIEVYVPWPMLDLAEELAEAVEAAMVQPDFDTTARVTKALEAWRKSVPLCTSTDR